MRALRALCLAAIFAVAVAHARDGRVVRLGNEGGYPPFSETAPDGSLRGLDVDVGNAICAHMKLDCVWVKTPWEAMIPALIANKIDAIVAAMTINEARKQKVAFTSKYYSMPLGLVARADGALEPDPVPLKGRRVGVERGTVADDFATRFWATRGVEVIRYRFQDEVYLDLAAGRIDASLTDYWQARGGFLNRPEGRGFAMRGPKIHGRTPEERRVVGEGVGIAVRKQDRELRRIFDQGIAAIRADGTYDRIVRKYFAEDIYGD